MPSTVQDDWMHRTLGVKPVPGARTGLTQSVDAEGNEVLDISGPSPGPGAPRGGRHGAPAGAKPVTGKVPRPADADFKPLHGKVPGPKNHIMCAVHHYVVDTDTHQVVANSVEEYKTSHPRHGHAAAAPTAAAAPPGHDQKGGQGHPAPPPAGKDGAKPDVTFEDEDVGKVRKGQFEAKAIEAAHFAVLLARNNAQKFVLQVEGACRDFAKFAEAKSTELTGTITFGDVLSGVASALGGKLGEKLAEAVTNETGKKIAGLIADKVKEKVSEAAKGAGQGAVNRTGMLEALKSLPDAARASASAVVEGVEQSIRPLADEVIEAVNNGKPLDGALGDFIMPFFGGQAATGDKALLGYGVPDVSSGKAIRTAILTDMVKEFEKQWIKAQATMSEQIAMTRDDLEKKAQAAADTEVKTLESGDGKKGE